MRKAKTWKQLQDEKAIREAELRKRLKEGKKDPLVENLKTVGNLQEAAAVFSYEGFQFLINTLGDVVAKKIEPLIDQKIMEILQGIQDGLLKAIAENNIVKIENSLNEKVKQQLSFGTSGEEVKQSEDNPSINPNTYSEKNEKQKPKRRKRKLADIELPTMTYTGVKIPRNHVGIYWSKLNEEQQRQVFLHYIALADEQDSLGSTIKFKNFHPEANAIYQRISKIYGKGGWGQLLREYKEKYSMLPERTGDKSFRKNSNN